MSEDEISETDHAYLDTGSNSFVDQDGRRDPPPTKPTVPTLSHRVRNEKSILALAISGLEIYAGTQGGEILVWKPLDSMKRELLAE